MVMLIGGVFPTLVACSKNSPVAPDFSLGDTD